MSAQLDQKFVLTTAPHGEHRLDRVIEQQLTHNALFLLTDNEGQSLGFTGKELDSLAAFWQDYRKTNQD